MLAKVRADQRHKEATIEIETPRLLTLLLELDISHLDYISHDIEGGEVQCLVDFPFATRRVKSWSIENNTSGPDDLFVHRDFAKI